MTDETKTIRVTYEGPAVRWADGWAHPSDASLFCIIDGLNGASVEILEPPFSAGHAVRADDGTVWVRTSTGWVSHGQSITYDDGVIRRWLSTGEVVELLPATFGAGVKS
jgi:hypothetical protein